MDDAHTSGPSATTRPDDLVQDPDVEAIRMQLRERITKLDIPDGTDPADAAKLRSDLEGLLDRFRPGTGQSVDDAVAALRYEFEDRVRDFAQDQRIDALIDEQQQQDTGADGKPPTGPAETPDAMPGMPDMPDTTGGWGTSPPSVETIRMQLRERITKLSIPDGTDPADAAKLRSDLEGLLDRFRPGTGQSVDDAVAALRYEFEDRVRDFAQDQRIDALIEEQNEEDAAAAAAPPPAGGLTDVFDDMAGTPDGGNAPIGDSPPPTTTEPAEPAPAPDMTTMPAADTPPVAEAPADTAPPTATASTDDVLGTTAVEDAVAASSAPAPTPDATMEPATTAPAAVDLPSIETPDVVELTADTADAVEGPDTMTVPDVAELGDDWGSEPEPDTQPMEELADSLGV